MSREKTDYILSPYRVLDLAYDKGLLCGKILGDDTAGLPPASLFNLVTAP